jgi:hypothetical protein
MPVNIAPYQSFLNFIENNVPQGMDIGTYIRACFFIYDQDPETGIIKIDDQSSQLEFYDELTDVHEVSVIIRHDDCNDDCPVCYTGPFTPFGNLSYQLPYEGSYTVEIDVRYTIQYDDGLGNITPYTFQAVFIYPVEWVRSGNYNNTLLHDIQCRIAKLQCEVNKRAKVGRDRSELQHRIFALNNYLYAICNLSLDIEEFDMISCAVKNIKKAC